MRLLPTFLTSTRRRALLGAISVTVAAVAAAQQTPRPPAGNTNPADDGVIALSPFEVQADSDHSYGALASTSLTRFSTELDKIPVTADVFTDTFMKDVGATTLEEVISNYSAGAGFSEGGGDSSGTAASNQPGDRIANSFTQLRGFNSPITIRDSLMPVGTWGNPGSTGVGVTSNFDLERVEIINGPQALLYGGGGAGGVINATSKQARFDRAPFGSVSYRIDQYGSKQMQGDVGIGSHRLAARFAFVEGSNWGRRINVGGDLHGVYGQLAFKPFENTTIRILGTQTTYMRYLPITTTLTATGDPRNNQRLRYLLATNQTGATNPVTGAAYPAGALFNGTLTWDNVDSFGGFSSKDPVTNDYWSASVETRWTSKINTYFGVGYDDFQEKRLSNGVNIYAPHATGGNVDFANDWQAASNPGTYSWQPSKAKGIRGLVLYTDDYFNGRAHSQTMLGADFMRLDMGQMQYQWYQAADDWSLVRNATGGLTQMPRPAWAVNNGPVFYGMPIDPNVDRVVLNGTHYSAVLANPSDPRLISPSNPLGTGGTGSTANYIITKLFNKGEYLTNYTQWFGGRLNTLVGVRYSEFVSDRFNQLDNLTRPGPVRWLSQKKATNYSFGADYRFNEWFHPFVSVSDSYMPPYVANRADPYNEAPTIAHGVGMEAGLKFNHHSGMFSGSLSAYRAVSKNDIYGINGTLANEINPGGLNNSNGGSSINVDRETRGLDAIFNASFKRNWRTRFNMQYEDGKLNTTKSYAPVYNDQFYATAQGQITYKNGTPVYVNSAAFDPKNPTVAATAPNAVPLTIAMISSPTSLYYANPDPVSGAINSASPAATVLKSGTTDNPILTGATKLPISALQITGVTPPSEINVVRAGDKTTGYPELSMNTTNMYTFDDGKLKGLRVGATIRYDWFTRGYYYYPNGVSLNAPRKMFWMPVMNRYDLILGYSHKFRHVTFDTQLNINNVFNHYKVVILPNVTTAYNVPSGLNATFLGQPRQFVWTNTFSF